MIRDVLEIPGNWFKGNHFHLRFDEEGSQERIEANIGPHVMDHSSGKHPLGEFELPWILVYAQSALVQRSTCNPPLPS